MRRKRLLDTYAILAWLQDEPSAPKVAAILESARQEKSELVICLVNLGELNYILRKSLTAIEVMALLDQILDLPIRVIPVTEQLTWQAAEIKACNPLSYADCFAVAAARQEGASVVTGDPEFKRVEGGVEIEWIGKR